MGAFSILQSSHVVPDVAFIAQENGQKSGIIIAAQIFVMEM